MHVLFGGLSVPAHSKYVRQVLGLGFRVKVGVRIRIRVRIRV